MPRLNIIATVCCSLLNTFHPGFSPLYMSPGEQIRSARIFLDRLFLVNPLIYPEIWPLSFTLARTGNDWKEITFGSLVENDVLDFPKLGQDEINPVAIELVSGPHALKKSDSLLTYMQQFLIKDRNLTREETAAELLHFPDAWKLQYTDIMTPEDFQPSSACRGGFLIGGNQGLGIGRT